MHKGRRHQGKDECAEEKQKVNLENFYEKTLASLRSAIYICFLISESPKFRPEELRLFEYFDSYDLSIIIAALV
jgi:hypothetical protein